MVDVHAHLDTIRRITVLQTVGCLVFYLAKTFCNPFPTFFLLGFIPAAPAAIAETSMWITYGILQRFFPYRRTREHPDNIVTQDSNHPVSPLPVPGQVVPTGQIKVQCVLLRGQNPSFVVNLFGDAYYSDLYLAQSLLMSIPQAGPLVAVDANEIFSLQDAVQEFNPVNSVNDDVGAEPILD